MEFFRLNTKYCKHPRHKFHTWDLLTYYRPKFLAYYRQMQLSSPFAVYVQYKCIGMKICLFLLKKKKITQHMNQWIYTTWLSCKCISFALSYMFNKCMLKFTGDLDEHWSISSQQYAPLQEWICYICSFLC